MKRSRDFRVAPDSNEYDLMFWIEGAWIVLWPCDRVVWLLIALQVSMCHSGGRGTQKRLDLPHTRVHDTQTHHLFLLSLSLKGEAQRYKAHEAS